MIEYDEIDEGLKNREFFLEYLPVVELLGGRCIGAEALSRWRRPTGVVHPADFLPVIENTPLSGFLSYYVIEEIAKDVLEWLKVTNAFISFNVPPEIIGRGGLKFVAERSGLMAVKHKIVVEIVERGVPDQIAVAAINSAEADDIRIALDDVGFVMANPIILSRSKVEIIKLDRDLVARIQPNLPLPKEIEAVIPLLRATHVEVVAEGVETAEQAAQLRAAGIRWAQGFHFSRPLSADDFKSFFAEHDRQ